jgi:glutamate-5-semialdehyde dehydrogenase
MANPLENIGRQARAAAAQLAQAATQKKNAALGAIAEGIAASAKDILAANEKDVAAARKGGMAEAQIDRLKLDEKRLAAIVEGVNTVKALPDPVGRLLETVTRPNGLRIEKHAVPIGVIGIIFESRPNVAVDAAVLCLKSGNACILRGGSDSWESVRVLVGIIQAALEKTGLPGGADAAVSRPRTGRRAAEA